MFYDVLFRNVKYVQRWFGLLSKLVCNLLILSQLLHKGLLKDAIFFLFAFPKFHTDLVLNFLIGCKRAISFNVFISFSQLIFLQLESKTPLNGMLC